MGFSDAPVGLYSTSQIAVDTPELLDYFQWKSNVHLVGISMGGMISLEMADAVPTRFQSLTLTSPTARRNLLTVRFLLVFCWNRHNNILDSDISTLQKCPILSRPQRSIECSD
ncbi:unnamed protein product [Mucor circinelloides]